MNKQNKPINNTNIFISDMRSKALYTHRTPSLPEPLRKRAEDGGGRAEGQEGGKERRKEGRKEKATDFVEADVWPIQ